MIDPKFHKLYYFSGIDTVGKFIEIDGINNLSINLNLSFSENHVLGGSDSSSQINAPKQIEISFDRTVVENDPLIKFTGKDPISNVFIYNGGEYLRFNNLFLNSYSAAFSVGDLPKINTRFTSYGEDLVRSSDLILSESPFINYQTFSGATLIPKLNSISITGYSGNNDSLKYLKTNTLNGEEIHNIYGFDFNLEINRIPYYSIGSKYPIEVSPIYPYKVVANINSKASSKYKNDIFPEYLDTNGYLNFKILVSKSDLNFMEFDVTKAKMHSATMEFSSQNTLEIKRSFIGHYGI